MSLRPRNKLILAVNAGSSSLKISLYRTNGPSEPVELLINSSISSISSPPAKFSYKVADGSNAVKDQLVDAIQDHESAFAHFLHYLKQDADIDRSQIAHICHRVVHGGDYPQRVLINRESYHHIEKLSDLAPLHNGAALSVIRACVAHIPSANSIAYFDTSFHRSIPPHVASYAIDQTIAKKRGLKKYGFHGLSYAFILRSVADYFKKPADTLNLIVLHLGSGASACAIKNGKSVDTSMGLTPLNGLPGATRSGAIDPSLIFHYTNKAGRITHDPKMAVNLHVTQAEDILNRKAGWKSLTGTTDFGEIVSKANLPPWNEETPAPSSPSTQLENPYTLAFDLFADRILNYVGSYYLKLNGDVDALVFSGGIGERSQELRNMVGRKVACLGFVSVDQDRNKKVDKTDGVVVDFGVPSTDGRRLLVCRTDEQVEMARACAYDEAFWESA